MDKKKEKIIDDEKTILMRLIFFNFIAIIFILLLFEFFLRFFNVITLQGYEKNIFFSQDNITFHLPNITKKVMGKKLKTDSNGFRIPLENFDYNKDLKSIFILGDSVSFGVGVKEENTFIGILRKKINYNFYNSSVSGHRIENYPFLLKKYHKQFPHVKDFIIFLCLNDIVAIDGIMRKEALKIKNDNKNFYNNFLSKAFLIKINFYLREKSTVFNLAKALGTQNVKRHFNYIIPFYENNLMLNDYERNLKNIIDYSINSKIKVQFVLLPYKHQIKKNCSSEMMSPQKQINSLFQKLNYQLFDFSEEFCNKNDNNNLFLNFDPMHLSKDGHKFVSQLILRENLVN